MSRKEKMRPLLLCLRSVCVCVCGMFIVNRLSARFHSAVLIKKRSTAASVFEMQWHR